MKKKRKVGYHNGGLVGGKKPAGYLKGTTGPEKVRAPARKKKKKDTWGKEKYFLNRSRKTDFREGAETLLSKNTKREKGWV